MLSSRFMVGSLVPFLLFLSLASQAQAHHSMELSNKSTEPQHTNRAKNITKKTNQTTVYMKNNNGKIYRKRWRQKANYARTKSIRFFFVYSNVECNPFGSGIFISIRGNALLLILFFSLPYVQHLLFRSLVHFFFSQLVLLSPTLVFFPFFCSFVILNVASLICAHFWRYIRSICAVAAIAKDFNYKNMFSIQSEANRNCDSRCGDRDKYLKKRVHGKWENTRDFCVF